MKKTLFIIAFSTVLVTLVPDFVYAHPGNTASDGCHYCRTNCAKWGEIEGARHCHNGVSGDSKVIAAPMVKLPTTKPNSKPTFTPKPKVTALPTQHLSVSPAVVSYTSSNIQGLSQPQPTNGGFFKWLWKILGW